MNNKEVITKVENEIYSREEVFAETLKYFKGDKMSTDAWINKYALKDSDGNLYEKTPVDMHKRLASELARIEMNYPNPISEEEIFELIKDFKYLVPQGGPMSGIGNNKQIVSLSNCFVVGHPHDSYGAILRTDEEQVQLMKRRGGVGHDLSHIRPSGSSVKNSALTSTGLVSFMERYSNTTREVAQDGRRGALMLSCSVKHPDAEGFIDAKLTAGKVTGANISLKITNDFMEAVKNGDGYTQQYPIDSTPIITKTIDPRNIWSKVIYNAWKSAEPGILFWDNIINESIPDCYSDLGFKTVSTNPCGEIPLCPYDSCRLLSINLYSYVINPFTPQAYFDFELFKKHVQIAQRIMDDIIDLELEKIDSISAKLENDPEPEYIKVIERNLWENIKTMAIKGRRTGLGVTAEGDMLAALGLTYGTSEATDFSVEVHRTLAVNAYKSSCYMAQERGSFDIYDWDREQNNPMIKRLCEADSELIDLLKIGRRNIALLTIAPAGTTSLMTQTTSGIEPVFLPIYKRRRKINPNDKNARVDFVDENGDSWEEYLVIHPKFLKWLKIKGYNLDDVKKYDENELKELIKLSPYHNATSADVNWVEKVKMQGRVQQWVDHSISVTVNLPENTTEEIVSKVYLAAWESGCKGITVYRDGSRSGVLISDKKQDKSVSDIIKETNAPKRPKKIECDVLRFKNNHEKWIGFTGLYGDDKRPYEIFTGIEESFPIPTYVKKGWIVKEKVKEDNIMVSRYDFLYVDKDGYDQTIKGLNRAFNPIFWNYARLLSGVLRHGMPIPNVISLVDTLHIDEDGISSWKTGVKRMFKEYIKNGTEVKGGVCPDCGNTKLIYQSGCASCDCGWSKC